jgi:thioredoxin-related protein
MKIGSKFSSVIIAIALAGCSSSGKETDTNTQQTTQQSTSEESTSQTSQPAATETKFVSYDAAVTKAKAENKYIFVDIYTDWCTWCHKLDKDVYQDPTVQKAFAKNFAITKINAESSTQHTVEGGKVMTEEQIAEKWNVTGFPTLVFLDTTEKPVFAYIGYLPPDKFLKLLDFVSTGAYRQSDDFQAWLKTHSG